MSRPRAPVSTYLATTANRLRESLERLPPEKAEAHASIVREYRRANGGFAGRAGDEDLYYTDFGVRALDALGKLDEPAGSAADGFARSKEPRSIIDVTNRLSVATVTDNLSPDDSDLLAVVESHRNADGGYGKSQAASAGSTYHTFLAVACYDALGMKVPRRRSVGRFLRSRLMDDSGFGETERARSGSTNPTAAALATGMMLGMRSARTARRVKAYLLGMQMESGGWRATAASPCADIMSTYTALTTLSALGLEDDAVAANARAFCDACEHEDGGFYAAAFDTARDVEYTYYGLGVRGVLADLAGR